MMVSGIDRLLEAAKYLDQKETLSSCSSSESFSSSSTSSASSPIQNFPHLASVATHHDLLQAWQVRLSAGSPGSPISTTPSPRPASKQYNKLARLPGDLVASKISSPPLPSPPPSTAAPAVAASSDATTLQQHAQLPSKGISLSVTNLPHQTTAIPLVFGQNVTAAGGTVVKYPSNTATVSTNGDKSVGAASILVNGAAAAGGFSLNGSSIIQLPSGTEGIRLNHNGPASQFPALVRLNGGVENISDEHFVNSNAALAQPLVVISPQTFGAVASNQQQKQHPQTISIFPHGPMDTVGVNLDNPVNHVDFTMAKNAAAYEVLSSPRKLSPSVGIDYVTATTDATKMMLSSAGTEMVIGNGNRIMPVMGSLQSTATAAAATTTTTILSSTNGGQPLNGVMYHSQLASTIPPNAAILSVNNKADDLSHLTLNLSTNASASAGDFVNSGGDPVNSIVLTKAAIEQQQQQHQQVPGIIGGSGGSSSIGSGSLSAAVSTRRRTTSTNSNGGSSVLRSGTREVHNNLEKKRRAQLRICFEQLKKQLPKLQEEKKTSNLSILSDANRHITMLKRKEKDAEHEVERLAKEKIELQSKLANLRRELAPRFDVDEIIAEMAVDVRRNSVSGPSTVTNNDTNSMDCYPASDDPYDTDTPHIVSSGGLQTTPPPMQQQQNLDRRRNSQSSRETIIGTSASPPMKMAFALDTLLPGMVAPVGVGGKMPREMQLMSTATGTTTISPMPHFSGTNTILSSSNGLNYTTATMATPMAINLSTTSSHSQNNTSSNATSTISTTTTTINRTMDGQYQQSLSSPLKCLPFAAAQSAVFVQQQQSSPQHSQMSPKSTALLGNSYGQAKNGLIVRGMDTQTGIFTATPVGNDKMLKLNASTMGIDNGNSGNGGGGNTYQMMTTGDTLLEPPTKVMKLVNGTNMVPSTNTVQIFSTTGNNSNEMIMQQQAQLLSVYSSAAAPTVLSPNGGLRVIGHHQPPLPPTSKVGTYQGQPPNAQQMPSGVVISTAGTTTIPHHILAANSIGNGAHLHKLLISGMATGAGGATVTMAPQSFPVLATTASGSVSETGLNGNGMGTSLPGGAQLNVLGNGGVAMANGNRALHILARPMGSLQGNELTTVISQRNQTTTMTTTPVMSNSKIIGSKTVSVVTTDAPNSAVPSFVKQPLIIMNQPTMVSGARTKNGSTNGGTGVVAGGRKSMANSNNGGTMAPSTTAVMGTTNRGRKKNAGNNQLTTTTTNSISITSTAVGVTSSNVLGVSNSGNVGAGNLGTTQQGIMSSAKLNNGGGGGMIDVVGNNEKPEILTISGSGVKSVGK